MVYTVRPMDGMGNLDSQSCSDRLHKVAVLFFMWLAIVIFSRSEEGAEPKLAWKLQMFFFWGGEAFFLFKKTGCFVMQRDPACKKKNLWFFFRLVIITFWSYRCILWLICLHFPSETSRMILKCWNKWWLIGWDIHPQYRHMEAVFSWRGLLVLEVVEGYDYGLLYILIKRFAGYIFKGARG